FTAGDVFPKAVLPGSIDNQNLYAPRQQIAEASNVPWVSRSNEYRRSTQIKRCNGGRRELAAHSIDKISHHRFRAAINEIGVGLGGIDPFPSRACGDLDLDATRHLELARRLPNGWLRSARSVNSKVLRAGRAGRIHKHHGYRRQR